MYVTPRARAVDGWGRYAVELARAVRRFGVEPVMLTADREIDPELSGIDHHVVLPPLLVRRGETLRNLLAAPRLRRVLSACDVVHGIAEPHLPLLALACTRRQPLVQTAHGTWAVRPLQRPLHRALFRRALGRVDLLVAQSDYTEKAIAARTRLPRHAVIPGGVRVEDFEPRSTAALPEWTRRGPIVLTVGQVKRRKGVHVALAAAAVVRQRHPTLQFAVVGPFTPDSSYVEGLRRQASDCGMRDHFHLIGEVAPDALVAWYQAADVFVLLPVQDGGAFEGLGLVYLEAGAAGVASIGTRDCGAAEAIVDGVTGLLVPQNDPVAAADAVCRMLEDRPLREKMAAAARARAHALSWTSLAAILADRYRELVSVRSERRW